MPPQNRLWLASDYENGKEAEDFQANDLRPWQMA